MLATETLEKEQAVPSERKVMSEIQKPPDPITWCVKCKILFQMLESYHEMAQTCHSLKDAQAAFHAAYELYLEHRLSHSPSPEQDEMKRILAK